MKELVIGARESPLALIQAIKLGFCLNQIGVSYSIKTFTTKGDKIPGPISDFGGKGVFVEDINDALRKKECDIALHSLKDVPCFLEEDLNISICLQREKVNDCWINLDGSKPENFKGKVGTSSPRRATLLKKFYPHLDVVSIRGNIGTRIGKMFKGEVAALVLAECALIRMGMEKIISHSFCEDTFVPSIGQGVIVGITNCKNLDRLLKQIDCKITRKCFEIERGFGLKMNADCSTAIGAYARILGDKIKVSVMFEGQIKEFFYPLKQNSEAISKSLVSYFSYSGKSFYHNEI